jgi:serine/threonine protein kinase/tetratricopeptide (TPR) repeat protein
MSDQPSLGSQRTADHVPASESPSTLDDTGAYQPAGTTFPDAPAPPADAPTIPGYAITADIARGGMGRVYAGRDLTLDREVAIKTLLPGANAERFVTEAKITARLPHPGIPPVYALGILADGTPYLAMKLIRGRTLADLLKDRPSPLLELPRFVQVFGQIAQAVGFAHARGFIHRDLKPLNVMVGEFGEVQVMDWGLAKELTGSGGATSEPVVPAAESDPTGDPNATTAVPSANATADQTRAGQVMGTPGFMPPEQARGEVAVDRRADVFALGALLCEILTGVPPYGRDRTAVVLARATAGALGPAFEQLDSCGADAELVALCKRCLSVAPADRPANAGAVAAAVAEHQAAADERARRAELDRIRAEGERARTELREAEQRKRRRVQLALIGSGFLILVGIGGFAWREDKQASLRNHELATRQAAAERDAASAVSEVTNLCDLGDQEIDDPPRWRQTLTAARAAMRRAESALEAGSVSPAASAAVQDTRARLDRDEADCETAERIDQFLVMVFNASEVFPEGVDLATTISALLRRVGVNSLTDDPETVGALRGHRLAYRLTTLVVLSGEMTGPAAASLAERLTRPTKPILTALLDTRLKTSGTRVEALLESAEGRQLTSSELVLTALRLRVQPTDPRVDLLKELFAFETLLDESVRRNPRDLLAHLYRQQIVENASFRFVGRDQPQRASLATLRHLASSAAALSLRPDMPYLWSKHGIALEGEGQERWAMSCFRRALELDPSRREDACRLARCQAKAGELRAAAVTCRQAVKDLPSTAPVVGNDVRAEAAAILLVASRPRKGADGMESAEQAEAYAEAREWLSRSLAQWRRELEAGTELSVLATSAAMRSWLANKKFAIVRDVAALKELPSAERVEWNRFWEEVRRLEAEAGKRATPKGRGPGEFEWIGDKIKPGAQPLPPPPKKG